jgi:hypothetical protein
MALLSEPDIPDHNLSRPYGERCGPRREQQVREQLIQVYDVSAASARSLKMGSRLNDFVAPMNSERPATNTGPFRDYHPGRATLPSSGPMSAQAVALH